MRRTAVLKQQRRNSFVLRFSPRIRRRKAPTREEEEEEEEEDARKEKKEET